MDPRSASVLTSRPASDISRTFISCPAEPHRTLGIRLPLVVFVLKVATCFNLEVHTLDDRGTKRRFCAANYQDEPRVSPLIALLPLQLEDGWNQVVLNLRELTRNAYGTGHSETLRVIVRASCVLRRVYFAEHLVTDEVSLPPDFRLFLRSD